MITHTFTRGWSNGASNISKAQAISAGGEDNLDISVASGTTDQPLTYTLNVQAIKGIYIVSTVAVTIKTNSAGTPANVIALVANVPFMWVFGDAPIRDTAGVAIVTDITELFVTNADPSLQADLSLRTLYDPVLP